MKYITSLFAVFALLFISPVFADPVEDSPDVVNLTQTSATEAGYDDESGDYLSTGQTIAAELAASQVLLASAPTTKVQGYVATSFRSSLDCVGQTFTDNSFLVLPDRSPYDKEGNPITTKDVKITKDSPISLLVWHAYQESKKSKG